jgi:hypothetical protein
LPTKARLCNRAPSGRQASRPASACRLLFTHTSSNSSASSALSCTSNSIAARVYYIAYPHSFTTYALSRRPTVQSVATLSRASSPKTTITTAAFVDPLSSGYSYALCVTFICPLDVTIITVNKAGQTSTHMPIAHSSPACAAHHPTLINPEGNL